VQISLSQEADMGDGIGLDHGGGSGGLEVGGGAVSRGPSNKLKRGTLNQKSLMEMGKKKHTGKADKDKDNNIAQRSNPMIALPMMPRAMSNLDLFTHEQQQAFDTAAEGMVDDAKEVDDIHYIHPIYTVYTLYTPYMHTRRRWMIYTIHCIYTIHHTCTREGGG
jgi:hypothetical protein